MDKTEVEKCTKCYKSVGNLKMFEKQKFTKRFIPVSVRCVGDLKVFKSDVIKFLKVICISNATVRPSLKVQNEKVSGKWRHIYTGALKL